MRTIYRTIKEAIRDIFFGKAIRDKQIKELKAELRAEKHQKNHHMRMAIYFEEKLESQRELTNSWMHYHVSDVDVRCDALLKDIELNQPKDEE